MKNVEIIWKESCLWKFDGTIPRGYVVEFLNSLKYYRDISDRDLAELAISRMQKTKTDFLKCAKQNLETNSITFSQALDKEKTLILLKE